MKHTGIALGVFITISFLIISCGAAFQGKLDMRDSNALLSDLSRNPNAPIPLTKPEQVFVSRAADKKIITVSWSAVKGANSYNVYRAEMPHTSLTPPADSDYNLIKQVYGSTVYDDDIPEDSFSLSFSSPEYEKYYYYKIEAENEIAGVDPGPQSDAVFGYLLAPPRTLAADTGASTTSVTVRWNKVLGASRYEVFRTDNPNGTDGLTSRGTVVTNAFHNQISEAEQGKEFYYVVEAISSSGARSLSSPVAMGFSLKPGAPETITGVTASKAESGTEITLKWKAVTLDKDKTDYNIFRNSSKSSQYKLLKKQSAQGDVSFTDTNGLEPNVTYYYYVQAQKTENSEISKSAFSLETTDSSGYLLSPPDASTAIALAKSVPYKHTELVWSAPIGSPSMQADYTYSVRHSSINTTTPAAFTDLNLTVESRGNGQYRAEHPGEPVGFYVLVTLYKGKESAISAVLEPAPGPVTAILYDKLTMQPNNNGVYPVKLEWNKPDGVVSSYDVYRSTAKNTGFKKVNTAAITTLSWEDTTNTAAVPSKFYYYKVQAVNSLGQGLFTDESAVSETYGHLTAQTFYREYEKTILSSQKKLTYMNRPGTTDKLGTETKRGKTGTVYYSANIAGIGARIIIRYTDYSDFVNTNGDATFVLNGDSNTAADMSSNGSMNGTITVSGMYEGTVKYGNITITSGAAGGGFYLVKPQGFLESRVSYKGDAM